MEMLIGKLIVAEMKEINNQQNARYAARRPANNTGLQWFSSLKSE